jgi:hypothetical protein
MKLTRTIFIFIVSTFLWNGCAGDYYSEQRAGVFSPLQDLIYSSSEYAQAEEWEQTRRKAQATFDTKLFEEAKSKKNEINGILVDKVNQKFAGNLEIPIQLKSNDKIKSVSPLKFMKLSNEISGDFAQINTYFEINIELSYDPSKYDYARIEFLNDKGYPMFTSHPMLSTIDNNVLSMMMNFDNINAAIATITIEIP